MNDKLKPIRDCDYTFSDAEFEDMWQLVIDSFTITGRPHNWSFEARKLALRVVG